jgi:phosphate/sulfate permease
MDVVVSNMPCCLEQASLMLFIATYFGMPVSTTHDVVGCILGFTIAAKGLDSVDWGVVTKIILSWLASPLLSGTFAAIIFALVKFFVMRANDPYNRAYYAFPVVLTVGVG